MGYSEYERAYENWVGADTRYRSALAHYRSEAEKVEYDAYYFLSHEQEDCDRCKRDAIEAFADMMKVAQAWNEGRTEEGEGDE